MSQAKGFYGINCCVAHLYVRIMNVLLPMRRLPAAIQETGFKIKTTGILFLMRDCYYLFK